MENFLDLTGFPLQFRKNGYMWMASTTEQAEGLKNVVASLEADGVDASWLEPREAARVVPAIDTSRIVGASFTAEDGIVEPHEMVTGFAAAARKLGVVINSASPVARIQAKDRAVTGVELEGKLLRADVVINAAGPGAAEIAATAGVTIPLKPYRRHSFVSGPAEWIKEPMPFLVDAETGGYFRQNGDGLIFGRGREYEGEKPTFSTDVKDQALRNATETARIIIPAMEETTVMYGYAGLYAMTPDLHAVLGPVEGVKGLYLACGFSGHGFMHAPAVGMILSEWILKGAPTTFDASPLMLERFEKGETIVEPFQI
jgi:sarcosine oxidase subunit beta